MNLRGNRGSQPDHRSEVKIVFSMKLIAVVILLLPLIMPHKLIITKTLLSVSSYNQSYINNYMKFLTYSMSYRVCEACSDYYALSGWPGVVLLCSLGSSHCSHELLYRLDNSQAPARYSKHALHAVTHTSPQTHLEPY